MSITGWALWAHAGVVEGLAHVQLLFHFFRGTLLHHSHLPRIAVVVIVLALVVTRVVLRSYRHRHRRRRHKDESDRR